MEGTVEYSDGRTEVRDLYDLAEDLTPPEYEFRLESLDRGEGENNFLDLAHFLFRSDPALVAVTVNDYGTVEVMPSDFDEGFGHLDES